MATAARQWVLANLNREEVVGGYERMIGDGGDAP